MTYNGTYIDIRHIVYNIHLHYTADLISNTHTEYASYINYMLQLYTDIDKFGPLDLMCWCNALH